MTDTSNSTATDLKPNYDKWTKAVAGVFARVQKKDIADVPLDVWKRLIVTTPDGIDVNPLYTRADEHSEAAVPGHFPFTRGATANGERIGWGVTESFGATGTASEVNKEILAALNVGTTTIRLDLRSGLTPDQLGETLSGVYLSMAPVQLNAGTEVSAAARALFDLVDAEGKVPTGIDLGAAPLTAAVDGTPSVSLDEAVSLAVDAAGRENIRTILVDAVSLSNQGASDAQEIGFALAVGLEYVRALTEAGLDTAQALRQISFRFAVSDDQFGQIAKLRAARRLWARVAEVLGHPDEGAAPQHAVTAPVMFTQRDPWVNMLRATVAAFAGGVGGASDVEVLEFDWAVPGGMPGTSRSFAHRIARNTNLLLLEESHLGFVIDPAGGSYYVEDFTDKLAEKAWAVFTGVEKQGGFRAALDSGEVGAALDETCEAIRVAVAHRRKQLTGINEFPNLAETPLPAELRVEPDGVRRWAAEFESFRNRSDAFLEAKGERPTVALIPLGPLSKHNIRTGFATNLLASGGIAVTNPGQVTPGTAEFAEAASTSSIAVICGTDQEYGESGESAVKALREAGTTTVLLAGAPKSFEGAEQTPDGYLNMKIDAAAQLTELLQELEA